MAKQNTEKNRSGGSIGFSNQTPPQILQIMLNSQLDAAHCVRRCYTEIECAARVMAQTVRAGGRLFYCGAGSSGLMALADSLELPGTFGIEQRQIQLLLAGGCESLRRLTGAPDDDTELARVQINGHRLTASDCMICVSASGSTAYTAHAQELAKKQDTPTIALAGNPGSPLLEAADVPILLQTPEEAINGSTRLGAGTAQKIALNLMSTLMASLLGHVYDGHMVNLHVDSEKLQNRAIGIVVDLAGCEASQAIEFLSRANGNVKVAVLLATSCADVEQAGICLSDSADDLGAALASISEC